MKNKDFNNIDKIAQDALEEFEVPLDGDNWMKFQKQLEEETVIDTIAQQALSGFEVPLGVNDWAVFEQNHLSSRKKLHSIFWWFKATEVILIALIVLGAALHIPCSRDTFEKQPLANTTKTATKSFSLPTTTNDAPNTIFAPKGAIEQQQNHSTGTVNNQILAQQVQPTNTSLLRSSTKTPASTQKILSSSPLVTNTNKKEVQQEELTSSTTNIPDDKETVSSYTENKKTAIKNTNSLSSISLKNTQLDAIQTIEPITKISSTSLPKPFVCHHSIGLLLGVGSNLKTSMGKTSIGYTSGLTYGKDFSRKFSLTTSLLASYKHYNRTDLIQLELDNSDNEPYQMNQNKTSHMLVLSIPVELNYTFFRSDKWAIYLTTGIAMNTILSRAYTGSQEVQVNNLTVSTELNSNDFERGLIEGGKVQQNIYCSIGGGFGAERKLGNKLRLYLQPIYYHAINKTNMDKIHTFNINVGIKRVL